MVRRNQSTRGNTTLITPVILFIVSCEFRRKEHRPLHLLFCTLLLLFALAAQAWACQLNHAFENSGGASSFRQCPFDFYVYGKSLRIKLTQCHKGKTTTSPLCFPVRNPYPADSFTVCPHQNVWNTYTGFAQKFDGQNQRQRQWKSSSCCVCLWRWNKIKDFNQIDSCMCAWRIRTRLHGHLMLAA